LKDSLLSGDEHQQRLLTLMSLIILVETVVAEDSIVLIIVSTMDKMLTRENVPDQNRDSLVPTLIGKVSK